MSEPARKERVRYTWSDYRTWGDEQRWQILDGEAYLLASPTSRHQGIAVELTRQMANYFRGRPCRLYAAPMDVFLSEEDVVQPDLLVVCDASRIKRTHIEGAPTLAVEIVSDATELLDRRAKLNLYARSGVAEYWIVTPWPSLVELLLLKDGKYQVHQVFEKTQELVSPTFPELKIALKDVFSFPLEPGEEPPVVKEPPSMYRTADGTRQR
jgi:Uma2 family endonuclease